VESHRGPDVLARQFSDWLVKHAVVPSTGGGPTLPNRLVLGRPRRSGAATALAPPPYAVRASPVASSIVRDLALLGTGPFVGGYQIGAAGVEAAQGRTGRAQRLAKGTLTGLRESAPGQLVTGHPGRAAKAFGEHPLLSLLDFAALESTLGRSAGAVVRAAGKPGPGVRGRLADIGSTARSPLALGHDAAAGVVNQRPYSKDLNRKAVQVFLDSRRRKLGDETVRRGRRDVPVRQAHSELGLKHLANRRGDMVAGRWNAAERVEREKAGVEGTTPSRPGAVVRNTQAQVMGGERVTGVKGRHARDVVALAMQGTITSAKHMRADLERYVARLDREHKARIGTKGFRHSEEARVNRKQARLARKLLDPRALRQAKAILSEAERHGRDSRRRDREKAGLGLAEQGRYGRAALETVALEHMGARHFTVDEHRALEREALVTERQAFARLDAAQAKGAPVSRVVRLRHDALAAREHRMLVSGRPPEKIRAHEHWAREVARKDAVYKRLSAQHATLHAKRQRLIGAQSVRQGTRAAQAVRKGRADLKQVNEQIAALSKRMSRVKAEHRLARVKAERHGRPDISPAIRYGEDVPKEVTDLLGGRRAGQHLPNEDIEAFLRHRGRDPKTVGYLPHKGEAIGKRAYHKQARVGARGSEDKQVRTGSLYQRGGVRTTARVLQDAGVKQAVQINHAKQLDRFISEHVMLHPAARKADKGMPLTAHEEKVVKQGGGFTAEEAHEVSDRLWRDTGQRYVPVSLHPVVSENTREVIRGNYRGPGGMDSVGQRLLNDRIVTEGGAKGGQRNVGLVSGHLYDRMNEHLKPSGPLMRAAQVLNRAFRWSVLPQMRWLTGNFVEPYIFRLTPHGSGINIAGLGLDIAKSRQMLRRLKGSKDPRLRQAAHDMEANRLGGLFVGQRGATQRRGLEDFPTLDATAQRVYGKMVSRFPAVETFADVSRAILSRGGATLLAPLKAFFVTNRGIERGAQHAGEGHLLRDEIQELTGSWLQTLRTSEQAWKDAMAGRVDTPSQHQLLDQAHQLLGKYDSFSPRMRALVQGPAPFLPWMLNAARFVFWTMPVHHSALTAFLTKVDQSVNKTWTEQHANTPPGSLRYAISNGKGGWIDLARYGPYGATIPAIAGSGLRDFKKQFYPQFGGVSAALSGQDPFGRTLKVQPTASNPKGAATVGDELGIAVWQGIESLVPYVSTVRRLQEGGGTAYANSTVLSPKTKPGSSHTNAPTRTFWPFNATYLGPATGKVQPLAAGASGLDAVDQHDLREAVGSSAGLDEVDREELRNLVLGR
jgi:hypothetical protein